MKIALLAPFEEQVPPLKYGGTELVVSNLTEELVRRGHQVTLIATGDSKTGAKLIETFPRAIRTEQAAQDMRSREALNLIGMSMTLSRIEKLDADIIHSNIDWRFAPFLPLIQKPILTTIHGPLTETHVQIALKASGKHPYVSISNSQREPFPGLNFAATVYNGIATAKFTFRKDAGNYLAFLGRMSPEKGPIDAIKIAKAAGKKLVMAAKVDVVDKSYFEKEIAPLIDGNQIQFIGEVDHAGKNELLMNAEALIAPINWREPFGLFLVEAMACGTPVLTRPLGAAPELVADGVTGFVRGTNEELVEALKNIKTIDRMACRTRVENFFSIEKMADGYERVYRSLLQNS